MAVHKYITPSVALVNPKYPHNVGAVLRACSCFGIRQLLWTGDRVKLDVGKGERLPREERMRGYQDVEMVRSDDRFFDRFSEAVPVAIEVRKSAENLLAFEHPENALYVFGPEDGGLKRPTLMHYHRFVAIPSSHCVNLSAAVYLVLYDRMVKQYWNGQIPLQNPAEFVREDRSWTDDSDVFRDISPDGLGTMRRRKK